MANCPNCGSPDIALKRETNVSWGRALVGYAVFGVVGGAVGAVTGEDRNVNACLDCGSKWKAETLYQILQMIKNTTNVKLDLSIEIDRIYLNQFVKEVSPWIAFVGNARADADKKFNESITKESEGIIALGCMIPLVISFCLMWGGFLFKSFLNFLISIMVIAIPVVIAVAIKKLTLKKREIRIEKLRAIRDDSIAKAENKGSSLAGMLIIT